VLFIRVKSLCTGREHNINVSVTVIIYLESVVLDVLRDVF